MTMSFAPRALARADAAPLPQDPLERILRRLFAGFPGRAAMRLWDGRVIAFNGGPPDFTLVVRDPEMLRQLVTHASPIGLVEAYFCGQMDVEGDLYGALALKEHFENLHLTLRDRFALLRDTWNLQLDHYTRRAGAQEDAQDVLDRIGSGFAAEHTRWSDRQAISFHYDVSNDFYGLWLDAERVYSCAYFKDPTDTLDQAQRQKLDLICRKLRLQPGDRLLDIGCGWGALVCWAARHYGVWAHGITLSQQQLDYAQARIDARGLQDRVTVELLDYRDLKGEGLYDKVASVGMFEHVGLNKMPVYLATVQRVLRPGGLFLNHGITHDEEGWNQTLASEFINRFVFPNGELDCVSNIQLGMERAGFEIQDVEALRRHYALTLRQWVRRLEDRYAAAREEVDEATYRVWRLYMAACAREFESGGTGIYQILASKRGTETTLPLTRADIYA